MEGIIQSHIKVSRSYLNKYELIGNGKDGEIYLLTPTKCLKYFYKEDTMEKELKALIAGQKSSVFPRVYGYGENFIVMEYVSGTSLALHMKRNGFINEEFTKKILHVFDEFKRLGFKRWDTEIRHILINEQGNFKVIDHKRAFSTSTTFPNKLFKGLAKYGLEDQFLNHVKQLKPELYTLWKNQV
jgi:putative serine/threonine protein kinase